MTVIVELSKPLHPMRLEQRRLLFCVLFYRSSKMCKKTLSVYGKNFNEFLTTSQCEQLESVGLVDTYSRSWAYGPPMTWTSCKVIIQVYILCIPLPIVRPGVNFRFLVLILGDLLCRGPASCHLASGTFSSLEWYEVEIYDMLTLAYGP